MADTELDSQHPEGGSEATGEPIRATSKQRRLMSPTNRLRPSSCARTRRDARTDMTVPEMRDWLRNWIANATGQSADAIDDSTPMVELGLSSRDAVAMASDIEDLTGVTLTATVAFRHPTIESLATVIIEGEPELDDDDADSFDWSRDVDKDDIAIVGLSTRFPGDMNTPDETWQALLGGRDAITDLPEGPLDGVPRGAADRRAGRQGPHPRRLPLRHQGLRRRVLRAVEDGSRQHRPAAADGAGIDLGGAGARAHPGVGLRGESVGVYIGSSLNDYSFLAMSDPSIAHPYAITGTASSIIANRVSYFYDFRGPSVAVDTACSSSLVAVHQGVQALRAARPTWCSPAASTR